jgi:hypothetical protein
MKHDLLQIRSLSLRTASYTNGLLLVAEKTFRSTRELAESNPDMAFYAISHSDEASTKTWLESVGGPGNVKVIVDHDRQLYASWGLGVSSLWHVLSPSSMWSVFMLGKDEGIWNKPTQSGSRWQTAGSFAVDESGIVRWISIAQLAADIPDLLNAVKALQRKSKL